MRHGACLMYQDDPGVPAGLLEATLARVKKSSLIGTRKLGLVGFGSRQVVQGVVVRFVRLPTVRA